MSPPETRIPPVVTARPVPAVIVVPEAIVVVDAIDPGAVKIAGVDNVIVPAVPVLVICAAVPNTDMFPATGAIGPPDPPVKVVIPPTAPVPSAIQLPLPGHM
jgi:hypothetical protein